MSYKQILDSNIVILGAGASGLGASYFLRNAGFRAVVFEKTRTWGGLCDNFEINGFRFDNFVHLSFTDNEIIKKLFDKTDYYYHNPNPYNYCDGLWVRHPIQNNLLPLPIREKYKIIKSILSIKKIDINNYEDWLKMQYGTYFAEKYPMRYTKKYWTIDASSMETSWVGNRMYVPSLIEVMSSTIYESKKNRYYAKSMRYPKTGGYKSFLKPLASQAEIHYEKKAIEIDISKKYVLFEDGTRANFTHLVSSLPLPEIVSMIKNAPSEIKQASKNLLCTSGTMVSLGFDRADIARFLWFYIYDFGVLPARAYSPSLKSPENAPAGKSSYQFEFYSSVAKPKDASDVELLDGVLKFGKDNELFKKSDVIVSDVRTAKYANVVFDKKRKKNRGIIISYLNSVGIISIGRFGKWAYLWSDQSILSGNVVDKILRR